MTDNFTFDWVIYFFCFHWSHPSLVRRKLPDHPVKTLAMPGFPPVPGFSCRLCYPPPKRPFVPLDSCSVRPEQNYSPRTFTGDRLAHLRGKSYEEFVRIGRARSTHTTLRGWTVTVHVRWMLGIKTHSLSNLCREDSAHMNECAATGSYPTGERKATNVGITKHGN
jgi:hypothetical protein